MRARPKKGPASSFHMCLELSPQMTDFRSLLCLLSALHESCSLFSLCVSFLLWRLYQPHNFPMCLLSAVRSDPIRSESVEKQQHQQQTHKQTNIYEK